MTTSCVCPKGSGVKSFRMITYNGDTKRMVCICLKGEVSHTKYVTIKRLIYPVTPSIQRVTKLSIWMGVLCLFIYNSWYGSMSQQIWKQCYEIPWRPHHGYRCRAKCVSDRSVSRDTVLSSRLCEGWCVYFLSRYDRVKSLCYHKRCSIQWTLSGFLGETFCWGK